VVSDEGVDVASQSTSEANLLAVLNSTPVIDGVMVDKLSDRSLASARDSLQDVVRGRVPVQVLDQFLSKVVSRPSIPGAAIEWQLEGPERDLPAARLVLAWSELATAMPGRLRACANPECTKFLIDHSKPNSARWCSMATCGNRLKARRHQERVAAAR
jgi:predicted RNA-binding Zn ribbon-like protein